MARCSAWRFSRSPRSRFARSTASLLIALTLSLSCAAFVGEAGLKLPMDAIGMPMGDGDAGRLGELRSNGDEARGDDARARSLPPGMSSASKLPKFWSLRAVSVHH